MRCDDCPVTKGVILGSTSPTKDLHHIKDTKVHKRSLLSIIDLGAL